MTPLQTTMADAHEQFMALVVEVRPELHRYCTRMTGSIFDAEDVVQDSLAKAFFAMGEMESPPPLRPWLFQIAHNTAMDFVRRSEHRQVDPMADIIERASEAPEVEGERVETALKVFAALPPLQRSALALKDVLGHSLEETAATMGTTVAAVKAALVRARANVAAAVRGEASTRQAAAPDLQRVRRYAQLFNSRDWERLRALFTEETRLEVVSRHRTRGPAAQQYFTRYAQSAQPEDLRAQAGWVDGRPVVAIFRPATSAQPSYFITLEWVEDQVIHVRDFRFVPYIAREASFSSENG